MHQQLYLSSCSPFPCQTPLLTDKSIPVAMANEHMQRTRSPEPPRKNNAQCELSLCLVVVMIVIESLRIDRSNVPLSIALDIAWLVLTAHWILLTTHWLRTRYSSHPVVHILLTTMPWAAGSSTDLAVAILLFTEGEIPAVETFLLGSAHAKPLVLGALSLIVQGVWPSGNSDAAGEISSSITQVLRYTGMLVVALTTGAGGKWSLLICGSPTHHQSRIVGHASSTSCLELGILL
jgi:hypothetical protein